EADENADALDKPLDHVSPNDRFEATDDGVKNRYRPGDDHHDVEIPTGHSRNRESQRVEHKTHLGKMARRERQRAVRADLVTESLAKILISAHANRVTEERNND